MPLSVKCLFFARAREITKVPEKTYTFDSDATPQTLLDRVVEEFPDIKSVLSNCVLSLNLEYIPLSATHPLRNGDELAIIPPISGG